MKKNHFIQFLIAALPFFASAQTQHWRQHYVDTTLAEEPWSNVHNHFGISTGVLWDKAMPNEPFHLLNGQQNTTYFLPEYSPDSVIYRPNVAKALQTYLDLKHSTVSMNISSLDTMLDIHSMELVRYNALPIILYDIRYNQADSAAYYDGSITKSNGHFDIPSSTVNPFSEHQLFSFGGFGCALPAGENISVVLTESFFIRNTIDPLSSYEIDMADGQGWQSLSIGNPVTTQYTEDPNIDFRVISIRKTKANGEVLYAYNTVPMLKTSGCIVPGVHDAPWPDESIPFSYSIRTFNGLITHTGTYQIKHGFYSTLAYNNKQAFGRAYVKYGRNNHPSNKVFKKPIIIIDGIDFGNPLEQNFAASPNLANSFQLGDNGWPLLWGCDPDIDFIDARDYMEDLSYNGYDIIFLDFWKGADYVQRNSMLLVELINRVNQNKVGNEEIVIIGPSMGGQIARYALSYMEHNDLNHCVRLNVSFDSPWNGANIPLSFQAFTHYTAYATNSSEGLKMWNSLSSPAALQLLNHSLFTAMANTQTYNSLTTNHYSVKHQIMKKPNSDYLRHYLFDQLQSELIGIGDYPKKCRNVAILNGSELLTNFVNENLNYIHLNSSCVSPVKAILKPTKLMQSKILEADFPLAWEHEYTTVNIKVHEGVSGSLRDKDMILLKDFIHQNVFDQSGQGCALYPMVVQPIYSFINTVSSINLATSSNLVHLDGLIREYNSNLSLYTHFEAYYAPAINQTHIKATHENMIWLLEQIYYGSNVQSTLNGQLSGAWNIPLESKQMGSLDILANGVLHFNANANRFDGNSIQSVSFSPNVPNPSLSSPSGYKSTTWLGSASCTSPALLKVKNGGKIKLGEAPVPNSTIPNNKSELIVLDGSVLEIEANGEALLNSSSSIEVAQGGKIVLHNQSKLILKNGSQLIIDDLAQIEIYGKPILEIEMGAEIIVRGKLVLHDNAEWLFTGGGKLVFDQSIPWINGQLDMNSYYFFGTNTQFELKGNGSLRPQLELKKALFLRDDNGGKPDFVKITRADVYSHPDAFLYSYSPCNFSYVDFNEATPGQNPKHEGLRLWGNNGSNLIRFCNFNNAEVGIQANWVGVNSTLQIHNCNFNNSNRAMELVAGKFIVQNCVVTGTAGFVDYGIIGNAWQGGSALNYNSFSHLQQGVDITGTNNTNINLVGNNFTNCNGLDAFALSIKQLNANLKCNLFNTNRTAIQIGQDAVVQMKDGANNQFNGNTLSIAFHRITNAAQVGLYLKNGGNQFNLLGSSANKLHIQGILPCNGNFNSSLPQSDYLIGNQGDLELDVTGNFLELRQTLPPSGICCIYTMPVSVFVQTDPIGAGTPFVCGQLKVQGQDALPSTSNGCGTTTGNNHPLTSLLSSISTPGGLLSNGNAIQTELLNGLNQLSYYEFEGDDLLALQSFTLAASDALTANDPNNAYYQEIAYQLMLTALENVYLNGDLVHNEAESLSSLPTEIQECIDLIENKLLDLDPSSPSFINDRFNYTLDKIMSYRNGGFYDEALSALNNSMIWAPEYEQDMRAQYWTCVMEKEAQWFKGIIMYEEFSELLQGCQTQFAGFNFKFDGTTSEGYTIEGNPLIESQFEVLPTIVDDKINIRWTNWIEGQTCSYSIVNSLGQVCGIGILEGLESTITLSDLSGGVYLLQLNEEIKAETKRFIKL